MTLGDLSENQQKKYFSEMETRWYSLSPEFREEINDVAFNFIEDRFFLSGQGIEFKIDRDGRFDKITRNLILSYAVDLKTSLKRTFLYGLLEER